MGQGDEEKAGEPAYYGYCTVAAERMRPGLSQQPGCLGIIGLGSLGICGFITALVGIFMWPSQVSPFMDANALQDEMDHALDFAVVAGGCEIVSSGHSFVYHRDKNAPQYERGFCWDQYTFKIRSADQAASSIVGEYMVETEDVRRTTPQSPEEGACEGTPQAPSTRLAAAGATGVTGHYPRSVPCWVATSSSAVKRGQLSGEEGRGWLDQAVGGYRCGNSICLKLADPATEYAQLAVSAHPPAVFLSRFVSILYRSVLTDLSLGACGSAG